jgi:hypothetical protein
MADPKTSEISSQQFQLLSATYQSPANEAFTQAQKIPAPPTSKTTDRTAYLAALRKATAEMQEQINKELTTRMEEDKARESRTNGSSKKNGAVDEAKEEDNYGEEVPEED